MLELATFILVGAAIAYAVHIYLEASDDVPGMRLFSKGAQQRLILGGAGGLVIALIRDTLFF